MTRHGDRVCRFGENDPSELCRWTARGLGDGSVRALFSTFPNGHHDERSPTGGRERLGNPEGCPRFLQQERKLVKTRARVHSQRKS